MYLGNIMSNMMMSTHWHDGLGLPVGFSLGNGFKIEPDWSVEFVLAG